MALGIFTDKAHPPLAEEIAAALGRRYPLWQELTRFMMDSYQLPGQLTYGGLNYGWNVWYRKAGKSLTSLYPQKNMLIAQVVLGRQQVTQALSLPLGPKVGGALRGTPDLHDGRWLFLKVTSRRDARDVEQLILLKRRPDQSAATR